MKPSLFRRLRARFREHKRIINYKTYQLQRAHDEIDTLREQLKQFASGTATLDHNNILTMSLRVNIHNTRYTDQIITLAVRELTASIRHTLSNR